MMTKLSVVLATRNEEGNIGPCLESVKTIAQEIILMDEYSTDKTREVAEKFGAKVYEVNHEPIFHITKQKALDKATGEWILQLDADERVSPELAHDISLVISNQKLEIDPKKRDLFLRHQRLIEEKAYTGPVVGYFLPRRNMFLGRPLMHGGVYPDGVIRLIKKGYAHFPQQSVHEQIQVDGAVSWLSGDLIHEDSPTLNRYFQRLNRYTDLQAIELLKRHVPKNIGYIIHYSVFKPVGVFINIFFIHAGFKDGIRGFMWAMFSSWHFPIAYFKYLTRK
jgi:glycosyltransferase involved in cell wall biosynthesis